MGECANLLEPEPPTNPFYMAEPRLKEVEDIVKKARAASAPGPDGIPYKVHKYCPRLTTRLWKVLRVMWRRGHMADNWMFAEGCFIPKEENSKEIGQFRTISLLNVEGKIFLAVLARRMTTYMLSNEYINIAVQKGCIPGVSGCLEHRSSERLKRTRVISSPLVKPGQCLKYHVLEEIQGLLKHYFEHFKMRFTVNDYTTSWQRLEVGIVTGCTMSVILFAAAMNLLVKSVEKESRGPVMTSGVQQPPTRALMDDMTITTKTVMEGRWMLKDLEELINWARMRLKPVKSRSLVLKKGRVYKHARFKIGSDYIPTVTEKPVKSLGKWFNSTLKDMKNQAKDGMDDNSGYLGNTKHGVTNMEYYHGYFGHY